MAKLYFKYGAMGSSKSAQALITQFNYEELGMRVWLIKPSIDDRDGASIVKSRVGLFGRPMSFSRRTIYMTAIRRENTMTLSSRTRHSSSPPSRLTNCVRL